MKPQLITKTYTFWGYFGATYFLILVGFILAVTNEALWPLLALIVLLAIVYYVLRIVRNNQFMNERQEKLLAYTSQNHLEYDPMRTPSVNDLGAVDDIENARNKRIQNKVEASEWTYCDFAYDLYNRTKYGEYKAATVHYGVMYTTLPRKLPNVFFDSIRARRRQFRFHFARNQRHSLEGDFDKHFVTYFPPDYTIDSMSFISPEVMWAMREASDYDIEIVGDRLYLYGPLYEPSEQLPEMSAKLANIKKHLIDNITTYRDERLPFEAGRKIVAPMGAALQRSRFWTIVSATILTVYILLYVLDIIFDVFRQ
ncbi:MAG TPA: hypothetical protein VJM46_04495 [Candidatus Saccharimonadales bacterium]|nr:hypothetical protein [Candidatus Saccharimonadales bacterium]